MKIAVRRMSGQGASSLHSQRCRAFSAGCREIAVALGGPGLFVIAFLDSSFLSFPEVTDVLIILLVAKHPERFLWYTTLPDRWIDCRVLTSSMRWRAAAGRRSCAGGFASATSTARSRVFRKYGLLVVAIPSILPPPVPFKIFVLDGRRRPRPPLDFLVAVTIGRGVRYFGEGLLAALVRRVRRSIS